jgi:hypothetical protein
MKTNPPENLYTMAESIESLVTVEIRTKGHHGVGVIKKLWNDAVKEQGNLPTLLAVQELINNVKEGDVVVLLTGLIVEDYLPNGENDGPPGAASLAYALSQGLGAIPVVICEEPVTSACRASLNAVGLRVRPLEVAKRMPWTAVVESFPVDSNESEKRTNEVLDLYNPKAMIAIERISVNEKGIQHTASGKELKGPQAKTQKLWAQAREHGILTVGIGDNGNEVGLGKLRDSIRKNKKFGAECICGCGGGIAAAEDADVAVIAAVSNWGAYGVAACMAAALQIPYLIHNGEIEERMIRECVGAGAFDGRTALPVMAVDGMPSKIHSHIVDILRAIVEVGLKEYVDRRF